MNLRALVLLPALASTGCLDREISNAIAGLHCSDATGGGTGSSSGATTGCPESTGSDDTSSGTGEMDTGSGTSTSGSGSGTDSATTGDTGSTTDPETSTTGEPMAVCGNQIVEVSGPAPEDCDDGNDIDDDGCRACGRDRLVFITSEYYQGGIFDGLVGADQRCKSLAAQAMLPNFISFKAWLSDSQTSARDRMFAGRGRYLLVNALVVANSWEALLAGELQNPINVTQLSETKNSGVYTGTKPDGTAAAGADFCADWTENMLDNEVYWGVSSEITADWTLLDSDVGQPGDCGADRSLYCFEQQ